ncbi:MAG: 6,7-dimethyl-8-ribityllumazine synthase, partial [Candidatus Woesearchaeota archaeon]|nr:6,7-dimethyl-8-ribityllumazine synthase [Candidatus Woesearchaeota archaeon]
IAEEHVKFMGGRIEKTIRVPGAFDMPLAVKKLIEMKNIDGVVTLGAVIEGDSDHDNIVAHNAARKIADLSIQFNKPVTLGIIGPKITHAGAVERIEEYSKRAVEACLKMIRRLKE